MATSNLFYTATVTVTNGDATVTKTAGAAWGTVLKPGMPLRLGSGGEVGFVDVVTNNVTLELTDVWGGTTGSVALTALLLPTDPVTLLAAIQEVNEILDFLGDFVTGPASATAGNLVKFGDASGKVLEEIATIEDTHLPTRLRKKLTAPGSTNVNLISDYGPYYLAAGGGWSNLPAGVTSSCVLEVLPVSSTVLRQRLLDLAAVRTWERYNDAGTWQDWRQTDRRTALETPSTTNANLMSNYGDFHLAAGGGWTNLPSGVTGNCILEVHPVSGTVLRQRLLDLVAVKTWERVNVTGSWDPWRRTDRRAALETPSTTNVNLITGYGDYHLAAGGGWTSLPSGVTGDCVLEVRPEASTDLRQRLLDLSAIRTWERVNLAGSWQAWRRTERGAHSFHAALTANVTGITAGVATKITFNSEVWDTNGLFNPANGRFTAVDAGVYAVSCVMHVGGIDDNSRVACLLYRNGASYRSNYESCAGGANQNASIDVLINATAGDYFEVYLMAEGTSAKTVYSQSTLTWFTAYRVGDAS